MSITLPPELERLVQEKVESGMYLSPADVIEKAIRLLHDHDQLRQMRLEELRREIAIGIEECDRGEVSPVEAQAVLAEIRAGKAPTSETV